MILLTLYYLIQTLQARKRAHKKKRRTVTIERSAPPGKTWAQLDRERRAEERAEQQRRKHQAEIDQAEIDAPFYESQLDAYARMHRDALSAYDQAQREVQTDSELNKCGAVVGVKQVQKHIRERDRAWKLVLQYERQIHAAQKALDKANRTLDNS